MAPLSPPIISVPNSWPENGSLNRPPSHYFAGGQPVHSGMWTAWLQVAPWIFANTDGVC